MNEQLPIIDWNQHGQAGIAQSDMSKELLALFIQQLPELEERLQHAFDEQNNEELHAVLHRLQGACAYCGLPRLRNCVTNINNILKQNGMIDLQHYNQIKQEISLVRAELDKHGIKALA